MKKHPQGTEIKAITYSNMQVYVAGKRVKSDNDRNRQQEAPESSSAAAASADGNADGNAEHVSEEVLAKRAPHGADIYLIVDI